MFDEQRLAPQNGVSATVNIKDWLLLDLLGFLNFIPILGSIAYIVIILVIAFSANTAKSMRSRVLMNLIWAAIAIVVSVVVVLLFGAALLSFFSAFNSLY